MGLVVTEIWSGGQNKKKWVPIFIFPPELFSLHRSIRHSRNQLTLALLSASKSYFIEVTKSPNYCKCKKMVAYIGVQDLKVVLEGYQRCLDGRDGISV